MAHRSQLSDPHSLECGLEHPISHCQRVGYTKNRQTYRKGTGLPLLRLGYERKWLPLDTLLVPSLWGKPATMLRFTAGGSPSGGGRREVYSQPADQTYQPSQEGLGSKSSSSKALNWLQPQDTSITALCKPRTWRPQFSCIKVPDLQKMWENINTS